MVTGRLLFAQKSGFWKVPVYQPTQKPPNLCHFIQFRAKCDAQLRQSLNLIFLYMRAIIFLAGCET